MATIFYPSLADAEVVHVEFLQLQGGSRALKLFVDSGFTGKSSIVLDKGANDLIQAVLPATQTTGALQGTQERAWVTCCIPALSFQATLIAILTDLAALSLPAGLDGMVGLRFLRLFPRWGAEQTSQGWQFYLSDGKQ
jgi:hypothetical protein